MKATVITMAAMAALSVSAGVRGAESIPPVLEPCVALLRDAERLACYDRAVAALRAGEKTAAVSAENMFGASASTQGNPEQGGVKREELKQITAAVTSLRRSEDGMIILTLDNGQVWRQQDSDVRMMMAPGDVVTVIRASLGTFRIADKSGRFSRFKRVR
jgi:hypothetical protein